MSANLFDEDPALDAELAAKAWATWQHHIQDTTEQLRERLIAVAVARRARWDAGPAEEAYTAHVESLDPQLVYSVLGEALWSGGPDVELVAEERLIQLRDAHYVDPFDVIEGRHRAVQPGGTP